MREQVQKVLEVLIGKPLWSSRRAADWEWFQFGQRRTINTGNNTKEVGEYALHVQCAWRITHGDEVVVGNHDLYYPPEETNDRPEDFNWEPLGSNRRDKRIAVLFQGETRQFLVRRIEVGEAGRSGYCLITTMVWMCFLMIRWRIFNPYVEGPHFVATGKGLET